MGDEFPRQAVDARETPVGLVGECRQFMVITPGKVQLNVACVARDDVLIVEEPLGGWRHTLSQSTLFGEIQASLMDPLTSLFEPLEQARVPLRIWVHLVVRGQTLGMLLDLRWGERHPRTPYISSKTLALRMQDEDRGRNLATFA